MTGTNEPNPAVLVLDLPDPAGLGRTDGRAEELAELLRGVMDDEPTKVVMLRLGADDASGGMPAPVAPGPELAGPIGLYQTVCFSRKPVVVQVDGRCAGPGMLLALYADVTLAAEGSTFWSPFAVMPEANLVVAALTMRLDRAKAWLLDPEPIDAARAEDVGLVTEVVPPADLPKRTTELATSISRMPADAISVSKMNINACLDALGVGHEFDLTDLFGAGLAVQTGGAA